MTWPQNAYVGQKVVRFRNSIHPLEQFPFPPPPIGEVVTITYIHYEEAYDVTAIDTKEYPSPALPNWTQGYDIRMFRPAQSTEKGMEILKEILITQKVKEDA